MDNNVGWVENKPLSQQQQLKEDRQKNLCVAVTGGGTSTGIARNSCALYYNKIRERFALWRTMLSQHLKKKGKGSHCDAS
jgi:hypothetical protein